MIRKATLTNKAVLELRAKIDCALEPEGRRRLGRSAVDFLISIRQQIAAQKVRLSKKQRDTTDEILAKAFSDEPLVVLEGQSFVDLAKLFPHATGDARVSALGEHVMLSLKRRLDDLRPPSVASRPWPSARSNGGSSRKLSRKRILAELGSRLRSIPMIWSRTKSQMV